MAQQPEKTDTSHTPAAKYSPATIGSSGPPPETTAVPDQGRTVATKATDGTIELRYTPRDPNPMSAKTST